MPSEIEKQLAAIDDCHGLVMARLRAYHFSRAATDPMEVRRAVQEYADRCIEFVNSTDHH